MSAIGEWQPNALEQLIATEAYNSYASGVAILNDPERLVPVHAQVVEESNLVSIVDIAEGLIVRGLSDVIRFSCPVGIRGGIQQAEHLYQEVAPHVFETVERAYSGDNLERLKEMNSLFSALRPMPLRQPLVYKYLCHGRLLMLQLTALMDDFQPSPLLEGIVTSRAHLLVKSTQRSAT